MGMDDPDISAPHDVFIRKIVEQFEGFTRRAGEPFRAHVSDDGGEAVLTVWQQGEEDPVLTVTARFDPEGARKSGLDEKLSLVMDAHGNSRELLSLGWLGSIPDPERGLDCAADRAEGEYAAAMGRILRRNSIKPVRDGDAFC
jgi:hypothetical protein